MTRNTVAFWRLYYHLVWATKNREHLVVPAIEARLYGYIVNKAAELDVYVYTINGWHDHIHLVVSIPPKHAVAYVVKRLKGASSHDLNQAGGLDYHFAWQRGYGAFSLGERQRSMAEAYVENQKRHHEQRTMNAWLERYAEFDEGPDDVGITRGVILHEDTLLKPVQTQPQTQRSSTAAGPAGWCRSSLLTAWACRLAGRQATGHQDRSAPRRPPPKRSLPERGLAG